MRKLVIVLLAVLLVCVPMSRTDAGRLKRAVVLGLAVGGGVAFALSASQSIGGARILMISSTTAIIVGGGFYVTGMHFHNRGLIGIDAGRSRFQLPRIRYTAAGGSREVSLPLVSMSF